MQTTHCLRLNLLGPHGREQGVQAAQGNVLIILITTIYCAPTRMLLGLSSKPFTAAPHLISSPPFQR